MNAGLISAVAVRDVVQSFGASRFNLSSSQEIDRIKGGLLKMFIGFD